MEPGTKTPIAGVAFTTRKHTSPPPEGTNGEVFVGLICILALFGQTQGWCSQRVSAHSCCSKSDQLFQQPPSQGLFYVRTILKTGARKWYSPNKLQKFGSWMSFFSHFEHNNSSWWWRIVSRRRISGWPCTFSMASSPRGLAAKATLNQVRTMSDYST